MWFPKRTLVDGGGRCNLCVNVHMYNDATFVIIMYNSFAALTRKGKPQASKYLNVQSAWITNFTGRLQAWIKSHTTSPKGKHASSRKGVMLLKHLNSRTQLQCFVILSVYPGSLFMVPSYSSGVGQVLKSPGKAGKRPYQITAVHWCQYWSWWTYGMT